MAKFASNSEKMKAYRAKKKKEREMSNAYGVTWCLDEAELAGKRDEMDEILNMLYDAGGIRITEKLATKVYGFLVLRNSVFSQFDKADKAGH